MSEDKIDLIDAIRISKDSIPPYDWILEIYNEKQLDDVRIGMVVVDDDKKLIQRVVDALEVVGDIDEKGIYELVFYAVMTNDPNDIQFLERHPELCERCGWCCRTLGIQVVPEDILIMGDASGVKYVGNDEFRIILPCKYQNEDGTCSIYDKRPSSCRTYPLNVKNGKLIIQRTLHCPFIFNFLVQKSMGFIDKALKSRGG